MMKSFNLDATRHISCVRFMKAIKNDYFRIYVDSLATGEIKKSPFRLSFGF